MDENTKMPVEELAGQIGIAAKEIADFIWPVLIKQAFINGITDLIQYMLLAIAIFIYVKIVKSSFDFADDGVQFVLYIAGIVLAILSIVAFFNISDTVTSFSNPEHQALQTILRSIKPAE